MKKNMLDMISSRNSLVLEKSGGLTNRISFARNLDLAGQHDFKGPKIVS